MPKIKGIKRANRLLKTPNSLGGLALKIICRCNTVITVCFLLFWVIEIVKSFFYNSTIINVDKPSGHIVSIIAIIILTLYIVHSFLSKKVYRCTIVSLFIMSISTIVVFYESIYYYLPWNHNEQFIISECILIYLALFSLVLLFLNVVIYLGHRKTT